MAIGFTSTKLVVGDLPAARRFYEAMGLKLVGTNLGGEDEFRQEQSWLAESDAPGAHKLILSRFVELSLPARPAYPTENWLCFQVTDVDAAIALAEQCGGGTVRAPMDRPEHGVRAAVIADPEGHILEIVGPMADARGGRAGAPA